MVVLVFAGIGKYVGYSIMASFAVVVVVVVLVNVVCIPARAEV